MLDHTALLLVTKGEKSALQMYVDETSDIQSPLTCFGVNREIFYSKFLQSDFLEVILATE